MKSKRDILAQNMKRDEYSNYTIAFTMRGWDAAEAEFKEREKLLIEAFKTFCFCRLPVLGLVGPECTVCKILKSYKERE